MAQDAIKCRLYPVAAVLLTSGESIDLTTTKHTVVQNTPQNLDEKSIYISLSLFVKLNILKLGGPRENVGALRSWIGGLRFSGNVKGYLWTPA